MLHGDMRTSRSWDAVARDLSSRFRVIAMDARGHGDSDWTPRGYAFRERAEDLTAFCERLGLSGVIGVGHSTGGVVMSLVAQRSLDLQPVGTPGADGRRRRSLPSHGLRPGRPTEADLGD